MRATCDDAPETASELSSGAGTTLTTRSGGRMVGLRTALHAVHADADAEEQLNRGEQSDVRTLWCLCHAIPATGVPPHGFELDYPSRLLGDRRSRHMTVQGYVIVDSKDLAGSWSR